MRSAFTEDSMVKICNCLPQFQMIVARMRETDA
jgi:hypothetical protein